VIERALAQSIAALGPVGQPGGYDNPHLVLQSPRGGEHIAVVSITQTRFAEYQANEAGRQNVLTIANARDTDGAKPFFVQNCHEHPPALDVRRRDKNVLGSVHAASIGISLGLRWRSALKIA